MSNFNYTYKNNVLELDIVY